MLSTALAFAVCASFGAVEGPMVKGELAAAADRYLSRIEANGFSGSVLVAKGDEVILAKGYGYADREKRVPVTARTVFDIGSITKQFTGAAVMKLVEEGRVRVEDPITKYFDDVPPRWRKVTVHHLLTHGAGFPDAIGDDYAKISREDYVRRAFESRPLFAPGERYAYSNVGFSLLGAIVEQRSGKGYEVYLREAFFAPLGMNDTGYVIPKYRQGQLAVGYDRQRRWGTPREQEWAEDGPYWNLRANGGILSTVWDMYKWHLALAEPDAALSKPSLEAYLAPHRDEGVGRPLSLEEGPGKSFYGYGWVVIPTSRGTRVYTHNGGNGIFFADCYRNFQDDMFIVMMTNAVAAFPRQGIAVLRILTGRKTAIPPLDPPDWKQALEE